MVELISSSLVWWHWIVLGLLLIASEIFMPLFIVLWFGLAAVIVGIVDLIFATTFTLELTLWITLSILLLTAWLLFFKEKTISKSGQSDSNLTTQGIVTQTIHISQKGTVRFSAPVLGSSEWQAISDDIITEGTPVRIVEVNGQLLKVKKEP